MKLDEFKIGEDFWAGENRYRCTDLGSRVVVAIRVDLLEVTEYPSPARRKKIRTLDNFDAEAGGWFNGPPYAVNEHVFDEDDLEVCTTSRETGDSPSGN